MRNITQLSRRALLGSVSSLVAIAATGTGVGWPGAAIANSPGARDDRTDPFNPYDRSTARGPSSQDVPAIGQTPGVPGTPYIVPLAAGWSTVALLTAGNAVRGGYVMTGLPDGLGAFSNGDGTVTVLMNHEIDAGHSIVRGHGGTGAFVSRWLIDIATLDVLQGRDFVTTPNSFHLWGRRGWTTASQVLTASQRGPRGKGSAEPSLHSDVVLDRLCSADAAPIGAFWDADKRVGYEGHILLNGEESGKRRCRAFAWVDATRTAYELPKFRAGSFGSKSDPSPQWENLLANPGSGFSTVVMANSDGGPSQVYIYIGRKQNVGTPVDKAGLTSGQLYSLRVGTVSNESRESNLGLEKSILGKGRGAPIALVPPGKGTSFLRPEDGAWDPRNPNVYFFATTDRNNYASPDSVADGDKQNQIGRSRLWAITFDDVRNIKTTGNSTARIEMLLDGTEGGDMFDNVTVDRNGIIYLCEDTGDARHNSKVWAYDTRSGELVSIAKLDPALFGDVVEKVYTPPRPPFGDDKEITGIFDVTAHFETAPWFKAGSTVLLAAVQPHFDYDGSTPDGKKVYEGGQLVMLIKAPAEN